LDPEEIKKFISGPRPKKVVHHCFKGRLTWLDVKSWTDIEVK